jgi:carbonic anhydrase
MKGRLGSLVGAAALIVGIGATAAIGAYVFTAKAQARVAHAAGHGAAGGAGHGKAHGAASAGAIWESLIAGNRRFVEGEPQERELVERREELAQGQHPQVIVLTCSDSRLCPELIFDRNLGDLFVIRTAGNIADRVALGSIEYAAEHLHARVLVVLGHEKCGAVAAAASGKLMPTPNLAAIVNQIAPALTGIKAPAGSDQRATLGVAANVQQSARDILKRSPVLRKEVAHGKLAIVKAVYRLKSGEVARL